jgi:hypothetical protein
MPNRRFNTQVAQPRAALAMGGKALKAVDKKKNPGLAKLPTKVRNKMGFMKDGGKVKAKGSEHPLAGREGNVKHKLKSQKELKKITSSDAYKKADYKGKTEMLGGKVLKKDGGRIRKMGGGMSTARRDMMSGYYKNDMGMKGGKMYKDGGKVGKKQQGYKARKDESIAMRIRKPRTARQLKASRDESYGKFGSKAKKSGKINR